MSIALYVTTSMTIQFCFLATTYNADNASVLSWTKASYAVDSATESSALAGV